MTDISKEIQEKLEIAWKNAEQIWGEDNSWKDDQDKCIRIQKKLQYFNSSHSNELEHIDSVIKLLNKGVALIRASIGWKHPAIGKNSSRTKIDKLRGTQWRFVITYVGFEVTYKTLMKLEERGNNPKEMKKFIQKCQLPTYISLTSPSNTANLKKWLSKEEKELAKFLGVTSGDQKIIEAWLVQSQSVSSWLEAVKLAKALRNASAHGYLVATKINDWKLKPALFKLTEDLAKIVTNSLDKLTSV